MVDGKNSLMSYRFPSHGIKVATLPGCQLVGQVIRSWVYRGISWYILMLSAMLPNVAIAMPFFLWFILPIKMVIRGMGYHCYTNTNAFNISDLIIRVFWGGFGWFSLLLREVAKPAPLQLNKIPLLMIVDGLLKVTVLGVISMIPWSAWCVSIYPCKF